MKKVTERCKYNNLSDRNLHKYFVFDENKKWTLFDFSDKMQISALLCLATCD